MATKLTLNNYFETLHIKGYTSGFKSPTIYHSICIAYSPMFGEGILELTYDDIDQLRNLLAKTGKYEKRNFEYFCKIIHAYNIRHPERPYTNITMPPRTIKVENTTWEITPIISSGPSKYLGKCVETGHEYRLSASYRKDIKRLLSLA